MASRPKLPAQSPSAALYEIWGAHRKATAVAAEADSPDTHERWMSPSLGSGQGLLEEGQQA